MLSSLSIKGGLGGNGVRVVMEYGVENGVRRARIEAFGCDGVGLWTKAHRRD
jgi:hypothetical protein